MLMCRERKNIVRSLQNITEIVLQNMALISISLSADQLLLPRMVSSSFDKWYPVMLDYTWT